MANNNDKNIIFSAKQGRRIARAVEWVENFIGGANRARQPIIQPIQFWAKLSDVDYSNGRYSFKACRSNTSGVFTVSADGIRGLKTDTTGYAVDVNGWKFAPVSSSDSSVKGYLVWMTANQSGIYTFNYPHKIALGKCDAAIAKGGSGDVSVYTGVANAEADTGVNVTGYARGQAMTANKWCWLEWRGDIDKPYVEPYEC